MKKILIYVSIGLLVFTISCKNEDLDRLDLKKITEAAILRTISKDIKLIDVDNLDKSNSSIVVEFDDFKNYDSMKSVDLFVGYTDTKFGGEDKKLKIDEVKISTIGADVFQSKGSGKPRATISFNGKEVLEALNITANKIDHSNIIIFRLALNMKDGRVFTSTNVRNSVAGSSAFKTPFRYATKIKIIKEATLSETSKYYDFKTNQKVTGSTEADVEYLASSISAVSSSDIQFLEMNLALTSKEESEKQKLTNNVTAASTEVEKAKATKALKAFESRYSKKNKGYKSELFNKSDFSLTLKFAFEKNTPTSQIEAPKKGNLYAYRVTRNEKVFYSLVEVKDVSNDKIDILHRREQKGQ